MPRPGRLPAAAGARRRARWSWRAVAVAAWYGDHRADQRDRAVRQALATAPAAAKAIFSYDYRTFDDSVANGRTFATGDFADEYARTTTTLKQTATNAAGGRAGRGLRDRAWSPPAPTGWNCCVYLNQYRRNVSTAGEKVDQNRVVLTMVPVDGEWKVDKATAI